MLESLLVLAIVLIVAIWLYNKLVSDRNLVLASWSDIDVQLKRRHTLVPQLVNSVRAYADHEKATMQAVTELRANSEASNSLAEIANLEQQIAGAVNKLIVVAEAYPELKADANFRQLQSELVEIEDHVQYARRFYNGAVRIFNTRIQSFPHLLVAGPFRFREAEFFEVEHAEERTAPSVRLD